MICFRMVKDRIKISSGGQGRNEEGREEGREGKLVYLSEGEPWRTR